MKTGKKNKIVLIIAVLLTSIALLFAGLELLLRITLPSLLAPASAMALDSGLPAKAVEDKFAAIKAHPPDIVVIGDSFVETGESEYGFISRLNDLGMKVASLGFSSACPSQYAALYDRLRQENPEIPVLILLYIGNDLVDEYIWTTIKDNPTQYMEARRIYYTNPESPIFWPCFDVAQKKYFGTWLAENSAVWRVITFMIYKMKTKKGISGSGNEIEAIMEARCDNPPFSERVRGRLFFFSEHNASVDLASPEIRLGLDSLMVIMRNRADDPKLTVGFAVSREEACIGYHQRDIVQTRRIVQSLMKTGVRMLVPTEIFASACRERQLYMPDGHWNAEGNKIFADAVYKYYLNNK